MKSRFRYSLRAILVVTALLALAIGYWSQMRRTENQVQRLIEIQGGWLVFHHQLKDDGSYDSAA